MTGHDLSTLWTAALARAACFSATMPLAASGSVPRVVRGGLGIALALVLASRLTSASADPWRSPAEAFAANAVIGLWFGLSAAAVSTAAASAGGLIDMAMASPAAGREVVLGGPGGPFGRLFALAFAALFFAAGSAVRLIQRVVEAPDIAALFAARRVAEIASLTMTASVDIAAPAILGQLLATAASACIARVAPRVSGLTLAAPAAAALTLVIVAASIGVAIDKLAALARIASTTAGR